MTNSKCKKITTNIFFNIGMLVVLSAIYTVIALYFSAKPMSFSAKLLVSYVKNPLVFFFFDLILLSLSALLLTLPVAIYVFGSVSTVALLSNILISNVVTITLCLGVFAILTSFVSDSITAVIMMPCHGLLKYINAVINTLGEWKYSYLSVNKGWSFFAIFLIILLFWLLVACKKRQDVLKSKEMRTKIMKESGRKSKWQ